MTETSKVPTPNQDTEKLRRYLQHHADFWQNRINDPYWDPDRTHIEMVVSQLQRAANELK